MKVFNPSNFAALIAIDWSDRKHDICELDQQTGTLVFSVISAKPSNINAWANALKQKYNGQQIAVVCELKKGPLIYALSKFKHIVLFTINPSTVAKYRKPDNIQCSCCSVSDKVAELTLGHLNLSLSRCLYSTTAPALFQLP